MKKHYSINSESGFSLIEVLVSLSLFIIVITMGIGSLLVLINANAKAQNIQSAVGNVQFALDSMAREIRTGYAYYCSTSASTDVTGGFDQTSDCDQGIYLSVIEGGDSLTESATNNRLAYRYNSGSQSIERKIGTGSWISLTDPAVSIDEMHFSVNDSETRSSPTASIIQPNVTIYIKGSIAGVSETNADFTLQTTVTKRVLDL
ncbi:hypothetical protein A2837_00015 [Candidatus Kaiserbacteria bacterium RIFCSPHIGHO2_01_FULL_46_22]|uniref:Prepilin-type N-terminal cleavage/methylation domain-containing protein n=1 Tax=Candidatus Kaiserbacteria bacterium RIFCSPHIGHO2_01_FULL_46_22 TaxID=1798475 RepID=A0A1F6BYQ5_9BACT|nr:MAG: hypothetical protein A2837_00015 [Candidatus Kaiserbacteria bacterium RIFCSPHIGHO2_01_FULL_46_22]